MAETRRPRHVERSRDRPSDRGGRAQRDDAARAEPARAACARGRRRVRPPVHRPRRRGRPHPRRVDRPPRRGVGRPLHAVVEADPRRTSRRARVPHPDPRADDGRQDGARSRSRRDDGAAHRDRRPRLRQHDLGRRRGTPVHRGIGVREHDRRRPLRLRRVCAPPPRAERVHLRAVVAQPHAGLPPRRGSCRPER